MQLTNLQRRNPARTNNPFALYSSEHSKIEIKIKPVRNPINSVRIQKLEEHNFDIKEMRKRFRNESKEGNRARWIQSQTQNSILPAKNGRPCLVITRRRRIL